MTGVLDMPADELLAVLEEQAAGGNQRAARVLEDLLAEEAATGELSLLGRLFATPHIEGDRHGGRPGTRERGGRDG